MKIIFTIDKITGDEASLNDGEGKIIDWPLNKLPAEVKEGDKIIFSIGEEDDSAKDILNEILSEN